MKSDLASLEGIAKKVELLINIDDLLEKKGLISLDQKKVVERERKSSGKTIEKLCVEFGFITETAINQIIEEHLGYEAFYPEKHLIDQSLLNKFPRALAERFYVIPLSFSYNTMVVAMVDPFDLRALDCLKEHFPKIGHYKKCIAEESVLMAAIDRYYGYPWTLEKILESLEKNLKGNNETNVEESSINNFLNIVLVDAVKRRASDIHLSPEKNLIQVRYRIDGILQSLCCFHAVHWSRIVARLKIMSGLDIVETRRFQAGSFHCFIKGREVYFRLATHPTQYGENIVIRVLDRYYGVKSLSDLGLEEKQLKILLNLIQKPQGMIVFCGPTGCGKTTTLFSLVEELKGTHKNIFTLEDPIEYRIAKIHQTSIQKKLGMSMAEGIKSILRQDPDVILIGEIRDEETAQMAFRASMTGHLVLTTLHAQSGLGVIHRLMDLGIKSSLFPSNLLAVVSQRLVRLLCLRCKQKRKGSRGLDYYWAEGCEECSYLGSQGRKALADIIILDQEFEEAFLSDSPLSSLNNILKLKKYNSFQEHAQKLIQKGMVGAEEVKRIVGLEDLHVDLLLGDR